MTKYLIFTVLFLCNYNKTSGLACFTSNMNSFVSGNIQNLDQKLQQCTDFIQETTSTQSSVKQILQCFSVTADYLDIVLKGCMPEHKCDSMKKIFKDTLKTNGISVDSIGSIDCKVCATDGCNSETFLLPENPPTEISPQKHNYATCLNVSTCLFLILLLFSFTANR